MLQIFFGGQQGTPFDDTVGRPVGAPPISWICGMDLWFGGPIVGIQATYVLGDPSQTIWKGPMHGSASGSHMSFLGQDNQHRITAVLLRSGDHVDQLQFVASGCNGAGQVTTVLTPASPGNPTDGMPGVVVGTIVALCGRMTDRLNAIGFWGEPWAYFTCPRGGGQ
jgi:hypothetical protein